METSDMGGNSRLPLGHGDAQGGRCGQSGPLDRASCICAGTGEGMVLPGKGTRFLLPVDPFLPPEQAPGGGDGGPTDPRLPVPRGDRQQLRRGEVEDTKP